MATVKPFKAIRPDAKYADKVISLPYDVMNRKEAAEMAADNPYRTACKWRVCAGR